MQRLWCSVPPSATFSSWKPRQIASTGTPRATAARISGSVVLSRATLSGWMASSAELLMPLYDLMVKRVLLSTVIHTDDTTVPVFDPTLPKTRTGRFWVYIGDVRNPYVVYDYTPRRTRDGPERFLKGFCGYLQADAFSGYDRICAGAGLKEVA